MVGQKLDRELSRTQVEGGSRSARNAPTQEALTTAFSVDATRTWEPLPVYPAGDRAGGGNATARLTWTRWSRCGQLPETRTSSRRARVITSAATLINRVR